MPLRVTIIGHQTKEVLENATCILPISVGQDYHEGAAFAETLRQLNASFARVIIVIADTLQKNTFILNNIPKDRARQLSLEKGVEWQERNQVAISTLTIPHEIIRWDTWLRDEKYAAKRTLTDQKYVDENDFQCSVDLAVAEFVGFLARKNNIEKKRAFDGTIANKLCKDCMLEGAAVMSLWMEQGFNYIAYPVGRSQTNKSIFDCLSRIYQADFQLLDIKIEEQPATTKKRGKKRADSIDGAKTTVTASAQGVHFSEEQKESLAELEKFITDPFLSQLFSLSRGHLLNDDALKIALILSIGEKVKLTCTKLVETMSERQMAAHGVATKAATTPPAALHSPSQDIADPIDSQSSISTQGGVGMFQSIDNASDTSFSASNSSSPEHGRKKDEEIAERRHSYPGRETPKSFSLFSSQNRDQGSLFTNTATSSLPSNPTILTKNR